VASITFGKYKFSALKVDWLTQLASSGLGTIMVGALADAATIELPPSVIPHSMSAVVIAKPPAAAVGKGVLVCKKPIATAEECTAPSTDCMVESLARALASAEKAPYNLICVVNDI